MNNGDEDWWDAQCGEYVLGTLRGPERDLFEKIQLVDDDVRERVNFWEQKLGALEHEMQLRPPPAHVLPSILRKIREQEQNKPPPSEADFSQADKSADLTAQDLTGTWTEDIDKVLSSETEQHPDTSTQNLEHQPTQQSPTTGNAIWKILTALSVAASLLFAGLFVNEIRQDANEWPIPQAGRFSVLQDEVQHALWLLTWDETSESLSIIALAPPSIQADQSHELWIVNSDDAGVSSVGLLPRKSGQSRTLSLPVPISQAASFAVSLEAAAGSPQAAPMGPILFSGSIQRLGESI